MGREWLSVKEAAQAMNVSDRTIRRRIQAGTLKAKEVEGPYGKEWRIPSEVITTAREVVDVVKLERETDIQTFALVVAKTINDREDSMRAEIASLRAQMEALTAALDKEQKLHSEQARELLEAISEVRDQVAVTKEPLKWWQRIFKR
jgi:excisionase family DNA binding protein